MAPGLDLAHQVISSTPWTGAYYIQPSPGLPLLCLHGAKPLSLPWGQHVLHFYPLLQGSSDPSPTSREAIGRGRVEVLGKGKWWWQQAGSGKWWWWAKGEGREGVGEVVAVVGRSKASGEWQHGACASAPGPGPVGTQDGVTGAWSLGQQRHGVRLASSLRACMQFLGPLPEPYASGGSPAQWSRWPGPAHCYTQLMGNTGELHGMQLGQLLPSPCHPD